MTKKLQPTRSLRSLLFGGPQLQYVVKLSMEECLQQLKALQGAKQLGQHPFEQMEINDQGRLIRWKLRLADPNVPIRGAFTLQADQQAHLRMRLGPPIHRVYFQFGALLVFILIGILLPGFIAAGFGTEALGRWLSGPEGIALVIFAICAVIAILIWISFLIPKFPDDDTQANLIQELSKLFPMDTAIQPSLTNNEIITPSWRQLFIEPALEYVTQRSLDDCIEQLRSIEASPLGPDYRTSPIEFNNLEGVVGWSLWVYPERRFNHTPYQVRVRGSFTPVEDGRIYVQVQVGPPLRASIVAGLYVVVVFGCAISWILYEQSRFIGDVPITIRIMSILLLLIVAMLVLLASNGAPVGFVPPVTKSRILYHLKQRLVAEYSA
jgi:hypothetical protein